MSCGAAVVATLLRGATVCYGLSPSHKERAELLPELELELELEGPTAASCGDGGGYGS